MGNPLKPTKKVKVKDVLKTDFSTFIPQQPKTTHGAIVTKTDENGKVTTKKIKLDPSSINEAMKKGGTVSRANKKRMESPRGY